MCYGVDILFLVLESVTASPWKQLITTYQSWKANHASLTAVLFSTKQIRVKHKQTVFQLFRGICPRFRRRASTRESARAIL